MAVDTEREDFVDAKIEWQRIRDVIAGQTRMHREAKHYLSRPEGMTDDEQWKRYVSRVTLYDASARTVEGLTGMAFAQDPIIKVPAPLEVLREDMTTDGLPLEGFAQAVYEEVLTVNRVGIFVDFPPPDPAIRSVRDAERANRRPLATIYPAETIFNWRTGVVNNRRVTVEVRLKELEVIEDEEFVVSTIDRIRVLQLVGGEYRQRLFIYDPTHKKYVEDVTKAATPLLNGKPLPYIPFWFINARDTTPNLMKPPLLGLANTNIAHFKTTGQLENVLDFAGSPQPYILGYDATTDDDFSIGSSEAWCIPGENISVGYLTLGTEGVDALNKRLDRLEQHMAMLGARMLAPDTKGVEAAETAQIHRQGEVSVVASACNMTSKAITEVLMFMAEWLGKPQPKDEMIFRLQTNFFELAMDPDKALALTNIWQKGVIAYSDLLDALKRGQIVKADRTEEAIAADNESGIITPASAALLTMPPMPTTGTKPAVPTK